MQSTSTRPRAKRKQLKMTANVFIDRIMSNRAMTRHRAEDRPVAKPGMTTSCNFSPSYHCGAVAVSANGDVTSANICGYQTVTLKPGYSLFTVTFKTVGKTYMDLKDVVLCNSAGVEMDDTDEQKPVMRCRGDIFFQKINPSTGLMSAGIYDYWTKASRYGWNFDDEAIEKDQVKIMSGEAVYIKNELTDSDDNPETVTLRMSGEVELTPYTMELVPGYSLVGNLTPVRVDLTKVVLCNKDKVEMDDTDEEIPVMRCRGDVFFQKINPETGLMAAGIYDYWTKANRFGWNYDDEPIDEGTTFLEPGEAVYFKNEILNVNDQAESVYLKFPSPISK